MDTRVIGLTGPIGCGKSTIARELSRRIQFSQVVSFAEGLRHVVSYVYGIPEESWKDSTFKATPHDRLGGATPRKALQVVGTEGFRAVYPNTWVDFMERRIQKLGSEVKGGVVIIDDVRFINEAKMIHRLGGELVYIESKRPNERPVTTLDRILRILNIGKHSAVHESESNFRALHKMADYVIRNNWKIDLDDPDDPVQQQQYLADRVSDLLEFLYEH